MGKLSNEIVSEDIKTILDDLKDHFGMMHKVNVNAPDDLKKTSVN